MSTNQGGANILRVGTDGRYAQAVSVSDTVYLAGQVAADPRPDIADQTRQVLSAIDDLLARSASSKSQLLSVQVWLSDMANYAEFNRVYDSWVDSSNKPARATVKAELVHADYLVEIMVVARRAGAVGSTGVGRLLDAARMDVEEIDVIRARKRVDAGEVLIVDVRDADAWSQASIPGAISAPRGMLEFYLDPDSEFHIPALAASKPLLFVCGSGGRSLLAAHTAQAFGRSVLSIAGGMAAWRAAGYPTEPGKTP
jgi:enamine deaminase RidA (YjgF/YER057c/UK114 family)/rhodanese-related sulfurtransferase